MILEPSFFAKPAPALAQSILGKVIRHRVGEIWLSARIIETEAYELEDKASHSSLGETHARRAMFMAPGTIYMYYARGADSLNFSALGSGNAVLIKSAIALPGDDSALEQMHQLNPLGNNRRPQHKLCSGQTLLCKSLGLTVKRWNAEQLDPETFYLQDDRYRPISLLQCRRLGIPSGRDEHLMYRYIDEAFVSSCTENPLTKRKYQVGKDYLRLTSEAANSAS